MKRLFKYMAAALLAVSMLGVGCAPDYTEPDQSKLPSAEDLDVTIDVNQETNYVSFTLNNEGMVPMFIFGDQPVNGKKNRTYAYSQNGISICFPEAGTYSVEVKAFNAHGISVGSKIYEFTLENSLGESGIWDSGSDLNMWNNAAMNVTFWFADDSWAQIADPQYSSTGNDNHSIVIPEGIGSSQWQGQMVFNNTGLQTTADKSYDFQLVLKSTADHGGVTIKLTQQDDDNVFFFQDAHKLTANEEYVYQVSGMTGVALSDAKLVLDFGGAQAGSTVEISSIILREHVDEGGASDFDPAAAENLWNNAVTTDITYWFANNDWSQIDNPTVVVEDRSYIVTLPAEIGSNQWQGQMAFNNTGIKTEASKTYDVHVLLNSTADHSGVTIKFVAQDDDNAFLTDKRHALSANEDYEVNLYGLTGIDCDNLKLVLDFGGGQGGATVTVSDIVLRESKSAPAVDNTIYEPEWEGNLWLSANILEMTYYYAPGWSQIDNPAFTSDGNYYTVTLPTATTDQWQAQVAFKTDMASSAGKKYDFYVVLCSNENHPGVTIKLVKEGDDNVFYCVDRHALTADEEYVYKLSNVDGIDMEKINLFFDFGGNAANTVVEIYDIIFQEHRE